MDEQTGVYFETTRPIDFPFPMISVCFGYDHNTTINYGFYSKISNVKKADLKDWWDNITYNPWNIVQKVCYRKVASEKLCAFKSSKMDILEIIEFSTSQGKCLGAKVTI